MRAKWELTSRWARPVLGEVSSAADTEAGSGRSGKDLETQLFLQRLRLVRVLSLSLAVAAPVSAPLYLAHAWRDPSPNLYVICALLVLLGFGGLVGLYLCSRSALRTATYALVVPLIAMASANLILLGNQEVSAVVTYAVAISIAALGFEDRDWPRFAVVIPLTAATATLLHYVPVVATVDIQPPLALGAEVVSVTFGLAYPICLFWLFSRHQARANSALSQSERTLSTLMSNLPGMAYRCRVDESRTMEFVSNGCIELTGYEPADLIEGRTITYRQVIHPDDVGRVLTSIDAALRDGEPFRMVYRIIDTAGSERWVWEQGRVVSASEEAIPRLEGFVSDVTDRVRAEQEISRLNRSLESRVRERTAQLEVVNQELESFSYSVSHDLRAPLRAIDGFSAALEEDCAAQLDDAGRSHLQRIRRATERMDCLVSDLLALSRVTRAELSRQTVDLVEVAREVASELRRAQPERRVDLVSPPRIVADADPRLIRIATENLLHNAWKYASKRDSPRVELGVLEDGERPVYFVRDNGVGFDMSRAERLFVPFQRLHEEADFEGSGVGLATVARIVRRHGGRVWAEAEPDRGATFYFTLSP